MYLKVNISDINFAAQELFINELRHLSSLIDSDTYCSLNFCVNTFGYSASLPPGFNTYILGFWAEVFDDHWFERIYNENPNARFIILSDMIRSGAIESKQRVTYIRMLHWNYFTQHYKNEPIDWAAKKFKLSSLSYFVTEFRFFVTASLLDSNDALFSWHNQYRSLSPFEYIFEKTGYKNRDKLLQVKERLNDIISIGDFKNDPQYNFNNNDVYVNSLINCTNETKDVSWVEGIGLSPGPYLTEKTWCALLNGTAILSTAQYGVLDMLSNAGFTFDYGWDNTYDNIPGDLDRLEKILIIIQTILDTPFDRLSDSIKNSCEYNKNVIANGNLFKYINNVNEAGLDKLKKIL